MIRQVSRVMTSKAVRAVLGPTGRVWKTPVGFEIGFELSPGRNVIGRGTTLIEAWGDAFLEPEAVRARAEALVERGSPDQAEASKLNGTPSAAV